LGSRGRTRATGRPEHLLRLAAEREGKVGVDGALVELIEDHRGHAFEPRVGLEPAYLEAGC